MSSARTGRIFCPGKSGSGPAGQDVARAELLRCGGTEYIVRRADPILVGDEVLYVWGLCVRKGADDPWSS